MFELHDDEFSPNFARIKVIGVGGGGGNAVNRMIEAGVEGVEFVVVNTDGQALLNSSAPVSVESAISSPRGSGPEAGLRSASVPPKRALTR